MDGSFEAIPEGGTNATVAEEEGGDDENINGRTKNDHDNDNCDIENNDNCSTNEGEDDDFNDEEEEQEPKYDKANGLKFYSLCQRMEKLWRLKREKPKQKHRAPITHEEKMKYLLPPKLLSFVEPESVFPLFRLLMPEKDSSRRTLMKEKTIARAYCDALGYQKNHTNYKMLYNFTDPTVFIGVVGPNTANIVGDLSLVVQDVLKRRMLPNTQSTLTIGDVNALLDELASLPQRVSDKKGSSHDWRPSQSQPAEVFYNNNNNSNKNETSRKKKSKKVTITKLRELWVLKLLGKGVSPLEHKWIVRLLLEKLQFGIGYESILKWYNPYSIELWSSHNSLKSLCNKLCDPNFIQQRKQQELQMQLLQSQQQSSSHLAHNTGSSGNNTLHYLVTNSYTGVPIMIENTISPMRAPRTSFQKALFDIASRHTDFVKSIDNNMMLSQCLALKFPTFCSEVKLDGERMIVHINKGVVTMHTRNGTWYSQVYSPVLGPSLRKAISSKNYNVNVVLDGEIVSWDNGRKQLVPFGNNRTIAIYRRKYMASKGLLDDRDENLSHHGDKNVMKVSSVAAFVMNNNNDNNNKKKTSNYKGSGATDGGDVWNNYENDNNDQIDDEEVLAGKECWLKFVVFDVLYIGGPDASKLFADSLPSYSFSSPLEPGSITHLTAMERKLILYQLIDKQENQVEIVPTLVIRSNGRCARGEDYFSSANTPTECDHPAYVLDSVKYALRGSFLSIEDIVELDQQRRKGLSDARICQARALAIDQHYTEIVERLQMEGLLFKDLASPYVLGKANCHWYKLKPDYSHNSMASDLDVVIIGAYFATGLRLSGQLSSFLCACSDSQDTDSFFTLCRINGRSVSEGHLQAIFRHTGFRKATANTDIDYGKWFRESNLSLPGFLSNRTFQTNADSNNDGWQFDRIKTYPDLWIDPKDSVILTVNAGEITASDEYSAGLSLRFPRISRVRFENRHSEIEVGRDGDAKPSSEVESEETLWQIFRETINQRSMSTNGIQMKLQSPSKLSSPSSNASSINGCRFLNVAQYLQSRSGSNNRSRQTRASVIPQRLQKFSGGSQQHQESAALSGLVFCVVEGTYRFDQNSFEGETAKKEGWLQEARTVTNSDIVRCFIMKHGGKVKVSPDEETIILGGRNNDARVVILQNALTKRKNECSTSEEYGIYDSVLKWTYVFSLVKRWLNGEGKTASNDVTSDDESDCNSSSDRCIKISSPDSLRPRFFDFLVSRSESSSRDGSNTRTTVLNDFLAMDTLDSASMLQQVLDLVGCTTNKYSSRKKQAVSDNGRGIAAVTSSTMQAPSGFEHMPWQYAGSFSSLKDCDKWILDCNHQSFWPYKKSEGTAAMIMHGCNYHMSNDESTVIVFPDIFENESFGFESEYDVIDEIKKNEGLAIEQSNRWNDGSLASPEIEFSVIASTLPLLRAMGVCITPHLHDGVTHILCDLIHKIDNVQWKPGGVSLRYFQNQQRGKLILSRLEILHVCAKRKFESEFTKHEKHKKVFFISPDWVNSKWK